MSVTMAVHSGHRYHFYIRSRFNLDAWHEKQSFLVHACLAWGIGFLPRMVLKGCHDFLPSPCVVSGAVRTAALGQGPNGQSASFRHIELQNASFRKMRFSLPGQTSTHLTEKHVLRRHPHGKAQSAARRLGRVRLSVRSDSKPRSAGPGATRPAAWRGGLLERICPVGPLPIVPRSLAGGCPTPPGRRDVKAADCAFP